MSGVPPSRKRKSADLLSQVAAVHFSSLLRLPDSLSHRIVQFLPLLDKLHHVSRLSSSFPRLTADDFKYDDVALNAHSMQQLSDSARLKALLHRASSLTVHTLCPAPGQRIAALFNSSAAAGSPAFPSLQRLRLWFKQKPRDDDGDDDVNTLFQSVAAIASLRSLAIKHSHDDPMQHSARLSSLSPTQLRSLTLSIALHVRDVAFLFSLPLTFLDLSGSHIHTAGEAAALPVGKASFGLQSSCRTLRLPEVTLGLATALFEPLLVTWPQQVSTQQSEDTSAGLEHLAIACAVTDTMTNAILSMPSLRTLQLSGRAVPTLLSHATSAPTSNCLRVQLIADSRGVVESISGAQPHALSSHCTCVSMLGLPSVNVVRRLERCINLVRLRIVEHEQIAVHVARTFCFGGLTAGSLSRVRSLTVTHVPLLDGDVVCLLAACPQLQTCKLHLPALTAAVLPVLATQCSSVRDLDITINVESVIEQLTTGLSAAVASHGLPVWFAFLTHLQLRWTHHTFNPVPPPSVVYPLLADLLNNAPLRTIDVEPRNADSVHFTSRFPHIE